MRSGIDEEFSKQRTFALNAIVQDYKIVSLLKKSPDRRWQPGSEGDLTSSGLSGTKEKSFIVAFPGNLQLPF